MPVTWLPPLVLFSSYGGDWSRYVDALYAYYAKDFLSDGIFYNSMRLSIKRIPYLNGKDCTFWHLIQEGQDESSKSPELRRCERLRWPKPITENCTCPEIKVWKNTRNGEKRILIYLECDDYLIVLAERKEKIIFWTAYPVVRKHRRETLLKEYEAYRKLAPPHSGEAVTPSTRGR